MLFLFCFFVINAENILLFFLVCDFMVWIKRVRKGQNRVKRRHRVDDTIRRELVVDLSPCWALGQNPSESAPRPCIGRTSGCAARLEFDVILIRSAGKCARESRVTLNTRRLVLTHLSFLFFFTPILFFPLHSCTNHNARLEIMSREFLVTSYNWGWFFSRMRESQTIVLELSYIWIMCVIVSALNAWWTFVV